MTQTDGGGPDNDVRASGFDGEVKLRDAALLFGNKSVPNFNQYICLGTRRESNEGQENEDERKVGGLKNFDNIESKFNVMHHANDKRAQPSEAQGIDGSNDAKKEVSPKKMLKPMIPRQKSQLYQLTGCRLNENDWAAE